MIKNAEFRLLPLQLPAQSTNPLYRQIYQRVRDAIARGTLRSGTRLPSSRSLASQIPAARGTVDLAYSLLASEGYVVCRGAAGTYVAPTLLGSRQLPTPKRTSIQHSQREASWGALDTVMPFQMGLPAMDRFPSALWSRLATRRARVLPIHSMLYPDANGYAPLRNAIATYLAVSRGVQCSSDQIFITSGFQGALGLIIQTFLNPGDQVWFEEPGYFSARSVLEAAGVNLVPVTVDNDGLDVAVGVARSPRARLVYVTPSHQAPLGVTLSLPRRLALLAWAHQSKSWIIEDDYDGEFRYASRPLPALKSLDTVDRVLYIGSFSKVLFPGLRLGYLVAPISQIRRVSAACDLRFSDRSVLSQSVVADFMHEGHFGRHIKKMRALYAERRAALAAALAQVFNGQVTTELQAGGMHLMAKFAELGKDLDLVMRAKEAGLAPNPLSLWSLNRGRKAQGLLLSFTNVPVARSLELVTQLGRAIKRRRC